MKKHLLALALLAPLTAHADEQADALAFRQLLLKEVRTLKPDADPKWVAQVSYGPDAALLGALRATSLQGSIESLKGARLATVALATRDAGAQPDAAEPRLDGRKLTIVIVPGVFAEFIKNRAMEDVLEKPSSDRDAFVKAVAEAKAAGNPAAQDRSVLVHQYVPGRSEEETGTLLDLIDVAHPERSLLHVGEMSDVHGAKVRVVLLGTPFSSGESLGDNESRARIMIRRLEKYLELTGRDQELAFVGYSRGTPLGMEILAQAKAENRPWLKNVRGMVSLSGVVLGSALADDATHNPDSATKKLLEGVRDTAAGLEKYPEGQSPGWVFNRGIARSNSLKWAKFGVSALPVLQQMNSGNPLTALRDVAQVDPRAPMGIFLQMWKEIGLDSWNAEYNHNIDRFRHFVDQLITATHELASDAREQWLRTHALPKNVTYYGLAAGMANPDAGEPETTLFTSPLGYGNGSYDDKMLIQNRKDYEKLSGGLALNDSQVAAAQSAFPAGVLASLNPANAGLKTKFLGVTSTHHWGMALREVNKMRGGQVNGFPREALLRAIATQVMIDSR